MTSTTSTPEDRILASLTSEFLSPHLREAFHDTSAAEDLSAEDRVKLEERFATTFAQFAQRGFQVLFREQIQGAGGDVQDCNPAPDVTVTEEDLLELDVAMQNAAYRRQKYPAKTSLYLERALQHQGDAAEAVKARVKIAEEDDDELDLPEAKVAEIGREEERLLVECKEQAERAKRFISVAKMVKDN